MMRSTRRLVGVAAVFALLTTTVAFAADVRLQKARQHFDRQDYAQAQSELRKVDAKKLTEDEKRELDWLKSVLPEAIAGAKAADEDGRKADSAFDSSRWQDADRLYASVMANGYAKPAQREHAARRRQQIRERLTQDDSGGSSAAQGAEPAAQAATPPSAPSAASAEVMAAGSRRMTLVDEMHRRDDLLWQRAVARMNEAIKRADTAIDARNFDEARQFAETALQIVEAARAYAQPPSKYEAARAAAIAARERVEDERAAWQITRAASEREEIAMRIEARRESIEQQRAEKIEQLFSTASQLRKEQRFREAAEAIRQVLLLDPANSNARYFLDVYEDFASLHDQRELEREFNRQMQATLSDTERSKIPWNHDILYPKNWLQIVERRRGVDAIGLGDEDGELNRRLEQMQPDISFDQQPFDQVVDFLVDLNKVNIAVDWDNLENLGIERDKPVTVRLRDVSLRTVLREVLAQVGGEVALAFTVGDGLLRIATKDKLDRNKQVLVYDIRDLLVRIPRFGNAPLIDLAQQRGRGEGGAQVFSRGGEAQDDESASDENNQELVSQILDIIRTTVEPDSWRETGGGDGALRELNGQLIVYNTADAHQQVRALLQQLRDTRSLMIAVEGRFLIVTSNFLEEIGVDIDFVFNAGNAGFDRAVNTQGAGLFDPITGAAILVPREFGRSGVIPAVPAVGGGVLPSQIPASPFVHPGLVPAPGGVIPTSRYLSPIAAQQGSVGLANPVQLNTGIPGSISQSPNFAPALSLAGTFLDNLQVDFLIRATQANRRSSIVQAPRLMLFNGQRAWVAVARTRQYVSSVTANVAEGAVGVQPVTDDISSGTSLDIEGTISADRKYVTLTVRTGLSEEPTLEDFEVQRASGNSPGIFIRLTDQETRGIRTTVSVPDGGTVLLGGLKQVGEIEVEAGVPILSKIPILKRAFTNTTLVKDTQTLLILLKAKILIQQEAEEEAFPTLSSLGG